MINDPNHIKMQFQKEKKKDPKASKKRKKSDNIKKHQETQ